MNKIEAELISRNQSISEELRTCADPKSFRSLDHMRNVMMTAAAALDYTAGYITGLVEREKKDEKI